MRGYNDDRPPSHDELMRWEADCEGEHRPDTEWILTNYDVWVKNPHYKGPPGPHPEDRGDDGRSCTGASCNPEPSCDQSWDWWRDGDATEDDYE